jgi:hypothetical protein
MKFANVHSVVTSGRFALRLAFFSFLCLIVFAMSSPRFGVAPAAGAQSQKRSGAQLQKRSGGKPGIAQETVASRESGKSEAKGAARRTGDAQRLTVCAQNQPITIGQTINGTLATGDCLNPIDNDGSKVDEYTFTGTAGQQISITMSSTAFDTYLYLLRPDNTVIAVNDDINANINPPNLNSAIPVNIPFLTLLTDGTYSIIANSARPEEAGAYSLTLTSGTPCPITSITPGQINGALSTSDCRNPFPLDNDTYDNTFIDLYTFQGTADQQVSFDLVSSAFNAYLYLVLPNGDILADDDNGGGGTNARLPTSAGFGRLPITGRYTLIVNSFAASEVGNYTLTFNRSATDCQSTPITAGTQVNGTLANGDCRLIEDGSFIDAYTFSGTAGQQVIISMTSTSSTLEPTLFLLSPTGTTLDIKVAPEGSNTARIPAGNGAFTLPSNGTYTILANSFAPGQTGNYTLRLTSLTACTTTLAAPGATVSGSGGQFNFGFTTQPGCPVSAVSNNTGFITVNASGADANGAGTVTYTVQPNPAGSARTGSITVNGQTFTITQGPACTYAIYPTVRPFTANSSASGRFTVITQNGCQWSATTTAPWITITDGGGAMSGTGRVRYTVAANETSATRVGTISVGGQTHTVTQTSAGTTPQIQFSGNAEFTVSENDGSRAANITVTRTGDTTGAATVEYATLDDQAAVPCDPNIKNGDVPFPQGTAYARCDYATTIDTLTFDRGETTKTFRVPLINDVFQEGNETFRIGLSNPQGATLGTLTTAIVTIQSDDLAPPTTNPINQIPFFVRQHYLDFLDREPEADEPWSGVLSRCGNIFTGPEVNRDCDRIAVSGAFFGSPEFRIKGFFVFLHYKAVFGSANNPLYVPEYNEFVTDARRVSGVTAEEVIAKRFDFSEDFLARTAVGNVFSGTTNEEFVDRVLANLGITLTNPDPATGETRNSLVNALNASGAARKTRAQVLRIIVESTEAIAAQFNRAFVAIQYYGYLRRTPEPQGYQNNLNVLNATNNSRQLINGFLNSIEYRLRFGANTTN